MTAESKLLLYTDGGARGNPGPAAIAYAIFDATGGLLEKDAKFIGERRTNNEAEYEALLWGLQKVMERSCEDVRVVLDSELVVRQISGVYAVNDSRMKQYAAKVQKHKGLFASFEIVHARRNDPRIGIVDGLVNEELARRGYPKRG